MGGRGHVVCCADGAGVAAGQAGRGGHGQVCLASCGRQSRPGTPVSARRQQASQARLPRGAQMRTRPGDAFRRPPARFSGGLRPAHPPLPHARQPVAVAEVLQALRHVAAQHRHGGHRLGARRGHHAAAQVLHRRRRLGLQRRQPAVQLLPLPLRLGRRLAVLLRRLLGLLQRRQLGLGGGHGISRRGAQVCKVACGGGNHRGSLALAVTAHAGAGQAAAAAVSRG